MNKAIMDGLALMPPAFVDGLGVFSSADGRPGEPTYLGSPDVSLVAGDVDFGPCLELRKTDVTQQIRYTGQTPVEPGLILRISTRVKVTGGPRPSARIASFVGDAGGAPVAGLEVTGPSVFLEDYNRAYDLSVIVATGARPGVDQVWTTDAAYAHVGLDLLGDTSGFVRVEDIKVEDVTDIFTEKLLARVDVRDFGAVGDGVTDDTAAADDAARVQGRTLLISEGSYFIGGHLTLDAPVEFVGQFSTASTGRVAFVRDYHMTRYLDAFGGDEQVAFEKAMTALYLYTDHESLDLDGRRIRLTRPVDVFTLLGGNTHFALRRVVRNGLLEAANSSAWDDTVVTETGSYTASQGRKITGIANAGAIPIASRVSGQGVGREVYVRSVDAAAGEITLSQPLWGAPASQTYTFTRHKYLIDFSGFDTMSRQCFSEIEFLGNRRASGILLADKGIACHIHDCWFVRPKDKAITSFAEGCNGITIETNEFLSPGDQIGASERVSVAINTNPNDMKIRNNRVVLFKQFAVIAGGGHIITGNHWFQGDDVPANALRTAGLILTQQNAKTTISGNYIDNAWIEVSNEHDSTPNSGDPFGTVTITGNIFTASDIPLDFTYIRLAPYAPGLQLDGLAVTDNAFKTIGGDLISRVESVDTSRGTLDPTLTRDVTFTGNTFESVLTRTESPARVDHFEFSAASNWLVFDAGRLPFGGRAMAVEGLTAIGPVRTGTGETLFAMPYVEPEQEASGQQVRIYWPGPTSGRVTMKLRCDQPV